MADSSPVAESGHDGAVASSARSAGRVVVVDQSGRQLSVLPEEPGYVMTAASFSPDGELLVTARRSFRDDFTDSAVKIWDWRQAQLVRTLASSREQRRLGPDGARIATSAHIKGIGEVWDAETGAKVATLEGTSIISERHVQPEWLARRERRARRHGASVGHRDRVRPANRDAGWHDHISTRWRKPRTAPGSPPWTITASSVSGRWTSTT